MQCNAAPRFFPPFPKEAPPNRKLALWNWLNREEIWRRSTKYDKGETAMDARRNAMESDGAFAALRAGILSTFFQKLQVSRNAGMSPGRTGARSSAIQARGEARAILLREVQPDAPPNPWFATFGSRLSRDAPQRCEGERRPRAFSIIIDKLAFFSYYYTNERKRTSLKVH
jgi:hypothetical protein